MKKEVKKQSKLQSSQKSQQSFNPLFAAFVAGIAIIPLLFLSGILSVFFPIFAQYVAPLIQLVLSLVILNGFYVLGKKYNSKLLRVCCYVFALFALLNYFSGFLVTESAVLEIASPLIQYFESQGIDPNSEYELTAMQEEEVMSIMFTQILPLVMPYLIAIFVLVLIYLVFIILFGVSLIKLKDEIRYAKVGGILNIVAACFVFTLLGILIAIPLLIAAYVFELIILYQESLKLKD